MHENQRRSSRGEEDPDQTIPPTHVEDLWGWPRRLEREARAGDEEEREADAQDAPAIALTGNEVITLYWAARDCLMADAYASAAALLRRLIGLLAEERVHGEGSRAEAERLLATVEGFLRRPPERPRSHG